MHADNARNNHDRTWRTSCEFLAPVRYRAVPKDPAALIQSLKRLWGSFPKENWRCAARSLVSLQCCCFSRPQKHKFGANYKILWGLTKTAPVFSGKLHLHLLEAPAEVLELFHARYFGVLDNLLHFLLAA